MPEIKEHDAELDTNMLEAVSGGVLTADRMYAIKSMIRWYLDNCGRTTLEEFLSSQEFDDRQSEEFVKYIWDKVYREVFPGE